MSAAGTEITESTEDDLSADGPVAQRIRAELLAHRPLPNSRFTIAATHDGRGMGLFAVEDIETGTYLFDYAGEVLTQAEFDERYSPPSGAKGVADYAVGVVRADGSFMYVDAASPALSNNARYMNHAGDEPNCVMWTLADPRPRLLMFARRDLAAGEELSFDYGALYWEGRDDLR